MEYVGRKGIMVDPRRMSLSIVVLGTWLLLLDNTTTARDLCTLCKVILFRKELDISPWKESYRQTDHWVYIQGLAETTSRRSVIEFL